MHALRVIVISCLAVAAGFFIFAYSVSVMPSGVSASADGIVALTGDEDRISEAVRLLAEGKAKRLLISGVNKSTRAPEIITLNAATGKEARLFRCCVDLDKRALNTEDNASETTAWVRQKGFRSLIVVTSDYHMPRALTEIGHQLPRVALVPFPVVTDKLRAEPWWQNSTTTRLLLLEYVKYIFANVRVRLNPATGGDALPRASGIT